MVGQPPTRRGEIQLFQGNVQGPMSQATWRRGAVRFGLGGRLAVENGDIHGKIIAY